jgi:hypothetical protein
LVLLSSTLVLTGEEAVRGTVRSDISLLMCTSAVEAVYRRPLSAI